MVPWFVLDVLVLLVAVFICISADVFARRATAMVRTRNMGGMADVMPRRDFRRIAVKQQQAGDSEESDYLPAEKRRKICQASKEGERGAAKNGFTNVLGELVTGLRSRHGRKLPVAGDDEVEDAGDDDRREAKGTEVALPNRYDAGIRRSTRQRKCTYDSLNQTWLLSCAQMRDYPIYVDVDVPSASSGGSQKPKKDNEDDSSSRSDGEFEDMYSRVKRVRGSKERTFYGLDDNSDRSNDTTSDHGSGGDAENDGEVGNGSVSNMEDIDHLTEDNSELETHDEYSRGTKYYLRQKKPIIDRFQVAIEPQRQRKPPESLVHLSPRRLRASSFRASFRSPVAHRSPHHVRRRHATHNSSSSSSSSCSSSTEEDRDERRFERRKSKSMARARSRCMPMNLTSHDITASSMLRDRKKIGSSLADVDPMGVDRTVTFESVGGHDHHVQSLKEMLLLPLMYPEVFEKFKITPPRGVLFYGPPGTGKTLVARALANECSQGERKVAFFMRKGADCLSKWVGESERQLRLLFDQAYSMRPSIIFFDEIDGLAPVRSTRQDQIHSSIVSTLLALMDGLDGRGEVIVIGATNRIDAIDPALRRPGRFDREFNFALPSVESRLAILKIHTKDWVPPLSDSLLDDLADKTVGFCGADLKALCAESAFLALRRRYPQIYQSRQKLQLDISSIKIEAKDFYRALYELIPASRRSASAPGRPLNPVVRPILLVTLNRVFETLRDTFPQGFLPRTSSGVMMRNNQFDDPSSEDEAPAVASNPLTGTPPNGIALSIGQDLIAAEATRPGTRSNVDNCLYLVSHRPRLLLVGLKGQGQSTHIAPAVLHHLERFPTHKLDLPALYAVTAKAPEESCSQIFLEAQRNLPAILYLPHVGQWWDTLTDTVRATFLTLLNDLETTSPLLLLATSEVPFDDLPLEVQELFDRHQGEVLTMTNPTRDERWQFFSDLLLYETKRRPRCASKGRRKTEQLPLAPDPEPRVLSQKELKKLRKEEESTLTELRLFLRDILYKLARDRRFSIFTKPVDTSEVTDYLQVIRQPMDLETMMSKIDMHKYETVADFLQDVDLICQNALEYNPDREPSDKIIRHRACALRDTAHSLISTDLDPEFEQICVGIRETRKERGESPTRYAPAHYHKHGRLVKPDTNVPVSTSKDDKTAATAGQSVHSEASDVVLQKSSREPNKERKGIDNGSPLNVATAANKSPSPAAARGSPSRCRRRRRPVIWFGQSRRMRKPSRVESCSEDSRDGTKTTDQSLANGDEMAGTGDVSKPKDEPSPIAEPEPAPLQNGDESSVPAIEESRPSSTAVIPPPKEASCPTAVADRPSFAGAFKEAASVEDDVELKTSDVVVGGPKIAEETKDAVSEEAPVEETRKKTTGPDDRRLEEANSMDASIVDDIEPSAKRTVIVDTARLRHLLDMVVAQTDGANVETLQKLHCRLYQIVRANRQQWGRMAMLNDLEKEIQRFSARTLSLPL